MELILPLILGIVGFFVGTNLKSGNNEDELFRAEQAGYDRGFIRGLESATEVYDSLEKQLNGYDARLHQVDTKTYQLALIHKPEYVKISNEVE